MVPGMCLILGGKDYIMIFIPSSLGNDAGRGHCVVPFLRLHPQFNDEVEPTLGWQWICNMLR